MSLVSNSVAPVSAPWKFLSTSHSKLPFTDCVKSNDLFLKQADASFTGYQSQAAQQPLPNVALLVALPPGLPL